MVLVDDLYRPYRPKRKTRATVAKDKGLEGLANIISLQMTSTPIRTEAEKYVSTEKGVETVDDAIAGAMDIIAENISDTADYRTKIRDLTTKKGFINTTATDRMVANATNNPMTPLFLFTLLTFTMPFTAP